jgi:hypothetical protein
LRLLRLGQLALALLEHVVQVGYLLGLLLDVAGQRALGPRGGVSLNLGTRALELVLDLGIDAFARLDELLFAGAQRRLSLGHFGLHAVQPLVEIPAGGLDEGRGQRFGQLDLPLAVGASDGGVSHGDAFWSSSHCT